MVKLHVPRGLFTRVSLANLTCLVPSSFTLQIYDSLIAVYEFLSNFFRLFVGLGLAEALSRYSVTVVTVRFKVIHIPIYTLYYIYIYNIKFLFDFCQPYFQL